MSKLALAGLLVSVMCVTACQSSGGSAQGRKTPARPEVASTYVGPVPQSMPQLPLHVSGHLLLRYEGTVQHIVLHTVPVLGRKAVLEFACLNIRHQFLNADISEGGKVQLRLAGLDCVGMVDTITMTPSAPPGAFTITVSVPGPAQFAVLVTQP